MTVIEICLFADIICLTLLVCVLARNLRETNQSTIALWDMTKREMEYISFLNKKVAALEKDGRHEP